MKEIIFILLLNGMGLQVDLNTNNTNPTVKNIVTIEDGTFSSSFEKIDDFKWFYITPKKHKNTSFHELSESIVYSWKFSHKAWIDWINDDSTMFVNNNHRAYPTVQLYKTKYGSFTSPLVVTLLVWVDMDLKSHTDWENDWLSFATFTDDKSDNWKRTVLVNLSYDWYVHLMHTTGQWKSDYIFQTKSIKFPQKQWVELKIYLDFSEKWYAKVWQDWKLVSHANIWNITNKLSQAHFGLYAWPRVKSGIIYNDDLEIKRINWEENIWDLN